MTHRLHGCHKSCQSISASISNYPHLKKKKKKNPAMHGCLSILLITS